MNIATCGRDASVPNVPGAILYSAQYDQSRGTLSTVGKPFRRMAAELAAPARLSHIPYGAVQAEPMLDINFGLVEAGMRLLAEQQGVDFDQIVGQAAAHFHGGVADSHNTMLTEDDIRKLAEDDDRAISQ